MAQQVLSISQLNEYIRGKLDSDALLNGVAVKGEISNYKVYPSGHHYFTLKDENSQLKCVMFKGNAMRLRFRPDNGVKVIAMGKVSVYPRDGVYQLYCTAMAMDGIGDLYAAFEQLKAKLAAQGLFDPAHKKPIPKYPGTIGIITSSAGAAIHDMLRILRKRYPLTQVRLLPVRVQGVEAPGEIAAAIRYANYYKLADLLIVGRGGGSIEELWSFNDENLARTIFKCQIPVISAVGHETDFTICDFVADLRAPTPSAAAELAAPDTAKLLKQFSNITTLLNKYLTHKIDRYKGDLKHLKESPALTSAGYLIDEKNMQLLKLSSDLENAAQMVIKEKRIEFTEKVAKLDALNPMSVLTRGFSAVYKDDTLIKTVGDIKDNDRIKIRMKDGSFQAVCDGASVINERIDKNE